MNTKKIIILFIIFCDFALLKSESRSLSPICDAAFAPCKPSTGKPIIYSKLSEDVTVKITPWGYVKLDTWFDSRIVTGTREDHVLFFPDPILPDKIGRDINNHARWHMTAVETRVGLLFEGPKWGNVQAKGLIEGDFRGVSEPTTSLFRLRNALGIIDWGSGTLLFGEWWNPNFIIECYVNTVSFNTGAPMELQGRQPQITLTQRINHFQFSLTAMSQRDFPSDGPNGPSTEYIRNSVMPNFNAQIRYYFGDHVIAGCDCNIKRLVPRLVSKEDFKVSEHINSFAFQGWAAFNFDPWSLRMKAIFAQNAVEQVFLSGYAVATVDPETDKRTYTNTAGAAGWVDFTYKFHCNQMELGFFAGYVKNLGARKRVFFDPLTQQPIVFDGILNAAHADYVARFSPRYVYAKDPFRLGFEIEFTRAAFGKLDHHARVINAKPVNNVRTLLGLYYIF